MSAGSERGAAAAPGVVPAPCASKVELRLSCRHLLDRDPLTKSDPRVVLLLQAQGQWVQVGRGGRAGRGRGPCGRGRGRGRGPGAGDAETEAAREASGVQGRGVQELGLRARSGMGFRVERVGAQELGRGLL